MKVKYITQTVAKLIDEKLMSAQLHGFSIDQLMELAGLSVAETFTRLYPLDKSQPPVKPIIVCGPGNNGGDGLVAARHLVHFGYRPVVVYPKESSVDLYTRLLLQCRQLEIPIETSIDQYVSSSPTAVQICFIDAIFGFGFKGSPRPPFDSILRAMKESKKPILSVDIPSGWDVEKGDVQGININPMALISLTAPKLCAQNFKGRHFIGGRFVPPSLAKEFDLTIPPYENTLQTYEVISKD